MIPSEPPGPGPAKALARVRNAGRAARPDLLAGGTFVALGLAFAVTSSRYELGSALQMGPGYYPLVLGGLLAALGVGVAVEGLLRRPAPQDSPGREPVATSVRGKGASGDDADGDALGGELRGPVAWRATALVVAAIVFFALGVRDLGLVPALLLVTFLAALADRSSLFRTAGVAVGLTVLCVLIFVVALQLRLPLVGSLFTG